MRIHFGTSTVLLALMSCGAGVEPSEPPILEQQWEVTYRAPDSKPMVETAAAPVETLDEGIPSTGINGLVPSVRPPVHCTPLQEPRAHKQLNVATAAVRVHLPGYCLDGEFRCSFFRITTLAAHASTRNAAGAKVECIISPTKRMEADVTFDARGEPTGGHLTFRDEEAQVFVESPKVDFGSSARAPFACEEGVTAAFSSFGPARQEGADLGLMIRYTE